MGSNELTEFNPLFFLDIWLSPSVSKSLIAFPATVIQAPELSFHYERYANGQDDLKCGEKALRQSVPLLMRGAVSHM